MESQTTILKQKINNIRKINDEHEQILKNFGITINNLPESVRENMEKFTDLAGKIGFYDLDLTYLQEWNCTKIEENFAKNMVIQNIKSDIHHLEDDVMHCQTSIQETKKFLDSIKENTKSDAEMEKCIDEKVCDHKMYQERKNKINIDKSINLDEIIRKVQLLEK